ncbi:MAG TPA: DUF4124 domain-containing protein [Chromatiales bacterium]|nr:DUF4124 domain-containing protein [Chromatiales bacterium]
MRHAISLALLLAALSAPSQAAIYKWVDEKGVTHFTEQPPASGQGEKVQPRVYAPATPAAPSAGKDTEAAEPKVEQAAPKSVLTVPPEQMAEQCQQARQRLLQLESSPRILYRGEDGEMTRATEEERQRMMDEERKRIELYCE